ncbi:hypothetical protein TEA_011884 [Camellia sinensis var. sinensis]|uniref:Uncharacterized protein n=1 Tax=Camellia sinensis var. sinensis TaxID=542762 RepID=A0A4S4DXE2_CAMSN|nr:hypothetical protein TEA_011884 [Camellia sinensis var. sinensis]
MKRKHSGGKRKPKMTPMKAVAPKQVRHGVSAAADGVVVVKPKPNKGLTSTVIDWLEKLIVKLLMYDTSQPHHYLAGNFGPVLDETPPCKDLTFQGYLPECLNGEFVRVGPNPKFTPVAGYHWENKQCIASTSSVYSRLLIDTMNFLSSGRFRMASTPGQGFNSNRIYRRWLAETFDGHETVEDDPSDNLNGNYDTMKPSVENLPLSLEPLEPITGMEFESAEDAIGNSMRCMDAVWALPYGIIAHVGHLKDNSVIGREFVC